MWALGQTGNWINDELNLNGDGDCSDAEEWDDAKTFNKVNEILTRDLDDTPGTTGNNYTLTYDPAGNLTSDAIDFKYEWDAFYRLRWVKTQAGATVAEYRYNGLGYRIAVHEDTDSDMDVDGSDLWYYSAYDERWRMVATYRSSDSDPKERFVHQQAGDGGYGGSSYIDLVAFREKDANTAWTTASDGVLEQRLYYCQNQHADVVALITSAGGQREMDRYSAYGVPFGLPVGDCNSDGDADADDRNQIQAWINASNHYDVRGDLDLDGDADSTDKTTLRDNYEGITLGRQVLTALSVNNARALAGFEIEPVGYRGDIRHRILQLEFGKWMSRDPGGYFDGLSLYAFVLNRGISARDPTGLFTIPCGQHFSRSGEVEDLGVGIDACVTLLNAQIAVWTPHCNVDSCGVDAPPCEEFLRVTPGKVWWDGIGPDEAVEMDSVVGTPGIIHCKMTFVIVLICTPCQGPSGIALASSALVGHQ